MAALAVGRRLKEKRARIKRAGKIRKTRVVCVCVVCVAQKAHTKLAPLGARRTKSSARKSRAAAIKIKLVLAVSLKRAQAKRLSQHSHCFSLSCCWPISLTRFTSASTASTQSEKSHPLIGSRVISRARGESSSSSRRKSRSKLFPFPGLTRKSVRLCLYFHRRRRRRRLMLSSPLGYQTSHRLLCCVCLST